MENNPQAGGNNSDLLSSILAIQVRNEEKISEQDRQFCQEQQEKLYEKLGQIEKWYSLFIADIQKYIQSDNP